MDIKVAREEFARIHSEATELVAKQEKDTLTDEENKALTEKYAAMDRLQKNIEDSEKLAKYSFENRDSKDAAKIIVPSKSNDQVKYEQSEKIETVNEKNINRAECSYAIADWMRGNEMDEKYSTVITTTNSSAYLPVYIAPAVAPAQGNAIRRAYARLGLSPIKTADTATYNHVFVIPSKGSDVTEGNDSGSENGTDGSAMLSKVASTCKAISSRQIFFSNLELSAVQYNLLDATIPALQDAKEMQVESDVMAAIIADSGVTQVTTLTGTTSAGLTYPKIKEAINKVPTRFNVRKVLFLSPDAYSAADSLTDSQGRPIFNVDPQGQLLTAAGGVPVERSDYLEAFGSSKVVGVVVSFVGFFLRDAGNEKLIRYSNLPTRVDDIGAEYVGYHAWGWTPTAMVKIKTSVS